MGKWSGGWRVEGGDRNGKKRVELAEGKRLLSPK